METHDYHAAIIFEKISFQNIVRPHENEKPAILNFTILKKAGFLKTLF